MKIGIIGSGNIGGTLGPLWAKAGHEVFFSSRHPEKLQNLVHDSGPRTRAGAIEAAARFGDVVLLAVPFGALPDLGPAIAPLLAGKTVLDASNPYPNRDGQAATDALASGRGTGVATAGYLPGAKVVRAFNTVSSRTLEQQAHRATNRVGIPLASDDPAALAQAVALTSDAGFDPVPVGALPTAARFDPGTNVFNSGMSGPEIRRTLALE